MAERSNTKEGCPPQAYLAEFLQNSIFVDYFNVFLSLPIFSQKILYKYHDRDFEFDPPLRKKSTHAFERSKFVQWLVKERLLTFLQSELHIESALCQHLASVQPNLSGSSHNFDYGVERQLEDEDFVKKSIGHVCGMVRFRMYIANSSGEKIFEFWKDAEKFNRTPAKNASQRNALFREIQLKYFQGGKGFTGLEDDEMWTVLADSEQVKELARTLSPTFKKTDLENELLVEPLQILQAALLDVLQKYWVTKFLLHCRAQDKKFPLTTSTDSYKFRSVSDLRVLQEIQNIDRAMLLVQGNLTPDTGTRRLRGEVLWNAMFPHEVDDSFLNSNDDVVTLQDDGQVTVHRLGSPSLVAETGSSSSLILPPIQAASSMSFGDIAKVVSSSETLDKNDFLPPKPEEAILRKSVTEDLIEKIKEAERMRNTKLKTHFSCSEMSELKKVLKKTSPIPLKVQQPNIDRPRSSSFLETSNITPSPKRRIPVQNAILPPLHEPNLISEIVKRDNNLCSRYSSTHEGPQVKPLDLDCTAFSVGNYRKDNKIVVGAVVSDGAAGYPFRKYLQRRGNITALKHLTFWQASHFYLSTNKTQPSSEGNHLRWLRARMIILHYLVPSSRDFIDLPKGMSLLLRRELPEGKGEDLLRLAQDYVCQFLVGVLHTFRRQDRDMFLNASLASRTRRIQRKGSLVEDIKHYKMFPPLGVPETEAKHGQKAVDVDGDSVKTTPTPDGLAEDISDGKEDTADEFMLHEQRMWRAVQLAVIIMGLETESLMLEPLTVNDLYHDETDVEGSLAYKPIISIQTSEIREQIRQQKEAIARALAERRLLKNAQERKATTPDIEVDDSVPVFARPFRKYGTIYTRPPRPRLFLEMMKNQVHVDFFLRYLQHQSAETPLLFWQAVQELRSTTETRLKHVLLNRILRKYFQNPKVFMELDCHSEVVCEIPKMEKVSASMLHSAQAVILRNIENKWFDKYLDTWPEPRLDEQYRKASTSSQMISQTVLKKRGKERTKRLWNLFVRNVARFRYAILHKDLSLEFKKFIKLHAKMETDKQKRAGTVQLGTPVRQVICNRIIEMSKLVADIEFLTEIERYRSLCNNIVDDEHEGLFTTGDHYLLNIKAHSIIMCFLDSELPPKLQVNIPQAMADTIISNYRSGMIDHGLFHEASVAIFPIMVFLWKEFQKWRFAHMFITKKEEPKRKRGKDKKPSTPNYMNIDANKVKKISQLQDQGNPRLVFSLAAGVRIILPIYKEESVSSVINSTITMIRNRMSSNLFNTSHLSNKMSGSVSQLRMDSSSANLDRRGSMFNSRERSGSIAQPGFDHFLDGAPSLMGRRSSRYSRDLESSVTEFRRLSQARKGSIFSNFSGQRDPGSILTEEAEEEPQEHDQKKRRGSLNNVTKSKEGVDEEPYKNDQKKKRRNRTKSKDKNDIEDSESGSKRGSENSRTKSKPMKGIEECDSVSNAVLRVPSIPSSRGYVKSKKSSRHLQDENGSSVTVLPPIDFK